MMKANRSSDSDTPYQTLKDGPSPSPSYGATTPCKSQTLTFCVHGNKYGFAKCCDDLQGIKNENYSSDELPKILSVPNGHTPSISSSSDHCHTDREGGIDKKARRKLVIATVLCLFFMVVEIVGGVLANSLAIATDAAHLLTDLASFMISLFAIWLASRPSTQRMSFGWHRAEVLGATVSVLMIWVVTGVLVYAAILRIVGGDYEVDATIMLITSAVGVGVNIIMGCSLHQHGHAHSNTGSQDLDVEEPSNTGQHGHAHDAHGKEKENINVKAAFIHVVGDFVQSLGVFVAALIIYFRPDLKIVDPICTFIFSILVLGTTISILRNTLNVLMEGIPKDIDFSLVKEIIMRVPGIVTVHNLRIWGLTTDKTALSAHLVIDSDRSAQDVLKEASMMIRRKFSVYEMTLQVENYQPDMNDCTQCQDSPEK